MTVQVYYAGKWVKTIKDVSKIQMPDQFINHFRLLNELDKILAVVPSDYMLVKVEEELEKLIVNHDVLKSYIVNNTSHDNSFD